MAENVEETNSGLRKEGDMEEIAEFAEKAQNVFENSGMDRKSVEKFNDWRPRSSDTKNDMKRKTVESASIDKREVEEQSNGRKDLKNAGEKMVEAGKNTVKKKKPEGAREATSSALRPFYSVSLKALRRIEESIYSSMMLKFNPYFFDAGDLSADIKESDNGYRLDLDSTDRESRETLQNELSEK